MRKILKLVVVVLTGLVVSGLFYDPVLRAVPKFMELYDNNPSARTDLRGKCTICHSNNDGRGRLTPFGQAFAENRHRLTPALRQAYPDFFTLETPASQTPAEALTSQIKEFYADNCAVCHGINGKGAMPNTPDWTDPAWQKTQSDATLAETINDGKGLMPAWKDKLNQDQITAMVKFIRQFGKGKSQRANHPLTAKA